MIPQQKLSIIERSLRCRFLGYLSLIPGIGLLTAIFALCEFCFVRRMVGKEWNPARRQLNLGIILAVIGLIISVVLLCFIVIPILYSSPSEFGYDGDGFNE